jgi:hypothetical protein
MKTSISSLFVEYSHAIVLGDSLPSYPSYDYPGNRIGPFVDRRATNVTDNNARSKNETRESKIGIGSDFGKSINTTERDPVKDGLGNWTRVNRSRKDRAK